MNHFQMPHADEPLEPLRYGNGATAALVARVLELGASRPRLEAKIFGGASILPSRARAGGELGLENAVSASRLLAEMRIPVVAHDVGGRHARKLKFRTEDGSAWVRPI